MTEADKCPQCEGDLPANFPPGVCPACLLRQGMSPSTMTGAAEEPASRGTGSGGRQHWVPLTPEELAPRFPQLEIVQLLGHGGMGAVYKVRQKELDRWAALKILPDGVASDPSFAERFQREARTLAQLSHPHIVTVYEFGQRDGIFFLLMEFIDGVTLRQAIRAGLVATSSSIQPGASGDSPPQLTAVSQPVATPEPSRHISPMAALGIVGQICDALQFAHEEGVVHRDIKPENILIDKRGRVKIADFGLAKLLGRAANFPTLTETHQVMGTPAYMAPEQMEGRRSIDHRADIFSLGVVFYELLTGELPLGRFAPPSQKYSLDVRLDEIVLRTLEKEPARRYQQASAVKHDVETLKSQPKNANPGKASHGRRTWPTGNVGMPVSKVLSLAFVVGSGVFLGLIGTVFFFSWLERPASAPPPLPMQATVVSTPAIVANPSPVYAQQQEQQRQLDEASRDPYDVNSIVRFTTDGVRLNPQAFHASELTPAQRVTLEKILNDMHQKYLKFEAKHSHVTVEGQTQNTTINNPEDETISLENDLWTMIDTELPISVQKLLRARLPRYVPASDWQIHDPASAPSPFGASMGGSMPPGMGPVPGAMPGMGGSGLGTWDSTSLRYPQLLGWSRDVLPLQISVGRRGKWFKWNMQLLRAPSPPQQLDSGEAPVLPSGLRRFWHDPAPPGSSGAVGKIENTTPDTIPLSLFDPPRDTREPDTGISTPESAFQNQQKALANRQWQSYAASFTEEGRDEFSFLILLTCSGGQGMELIDFLCKKFPQSNLQSPELKTRLQSIAQKFRQSPPSRTEFRAAATTLIRETLSESSQVFFEAIAEFRHPASENPSSNETEPGQLIMLSTTENEARGSHISLPDMPAEEGNPITFRRRNGKWEIDGVEEFPAILANWLAAESKKGDPAPVQPEAAK
ncbi:MAG: serine/threonine-protein kinase [Planctomycetaceae bacterium]